MKQVKFVVVMKGRTKPLIIDLIEYLFQDILCLTRYLRISL